MEDNPLLAPPIGVRIAPAEALQWPYRHELSADLDGDGTADTVTLAADVRLSPAGQPLWEDGHRWALVVASGGDATLAYSAFVPHGFVEAAVLVPSSEGKREVLVLERTRDQLRALSVSYAGAGTATSASGAYYQIESWVPGFARLQD